MGSLQFCQWDVAGRTLQVVCEGGGVGMVFSHAGQARRERERRVEGLRMETGGARSSYGG